MSEDKIKNLGGRPSTLTREIGQKIIDSVRKMLSINHSSELHCVPRTTTQSWMDRGRVDIEAGIESDFAWFSANIKKARSEFIEESVYRLRGGVQNWQATAWLLERCCAEDFGKDAELYKQLLDDYKMLMQSIVDQNKGVNHGNKAANSETS
jgi:hypothetical protein